jgi:hypothetical protein
LHFRNRIETEKNAAGKPVLTLRRERMELRPMRVPQQPLKSGLPVEPGAACGFQRLFDGRQDVLATIVLRTRMAFVTRAPRAGAVCAWRPASRAQAAKSYGSDLGSDV